MDRDHRGKSPATTPGLRPVSALILQRGGHPSPVMTLIIIVMVIIIITLVVNPEVVPTLEREGNPSQAQIHTTRTARNLNFTLSMRIMRGKPASPVYCRTRGLPSDLENTDSARPQINHKVVNCTGPTGSGSGVQYQIVDSSFDGSVEYRCIGTGTGIVEEGAPSLKERSTGRSRDHAGDERNLTCGEYNYTVDW
jgi:hypothetical protein